MASAYMLGGTGLKFRVFDRRSFLLHMLEFDVKYQSLLTDTEIYAYHKAVQAQ
jgi:hypothetical protein